MLKPNSNSNINSNHNATEEQTKRISIRNKLETCSVRNTNRVTKKIEVSTAYYELSHYAKITNSVYPHHTHLLITIRRRILKKKYHFIDLEFSK